MAKRPANYGLEVIKRCFLDNVLVCCERRGTNENTNEVCVSTCSKRLIRRFGLRLIFDDIADELNDRLCKTLGKEMAPTTPIFRVIGAKYSLEAACYGGGCV